jgi:hypothetical protein
VSYADISAERRAWQAAWDDLRQVRQRPPKLQVIDFAAGVHASEYVVSAGLPRGAGDDMAVVPGVAACAEADPSVRGPRRWLSPPEPPLTWPGS